MADAFSIQKNAWPEIRVTITAVPNVDYNATHWWAYSEGVQAVINESIGYRLPDCSFHKPGVKRIKATVGASPRPAFNRNRLCAGLRDSHCQPRAARIMSGQQHRDLSSTSNVLPRVPSKALR